MRRGGVSGLAGGALVVLLLTAAAVLFVLVLLPHLAESMASFAVRRAPPYDGADVSGIVRALAVLLPLFGGVRLLTILRDRPARAGDRRGTPGPVGVSAPLPGLVLRRRGMSRVFGLLISAVFGPLPLVVLGADAWAVAQLVLGGELAHAYAIVLLQFALGFTVVTVGFARTLMRTLGPRVTLATTGAARRGRPVTLQWLALGVSPSVRSLRLQLIGREEVAREGAGGEPATEWQRRVFHRSDVVARSRPSGSPADRRRSRFPSTPSASTAVTAGSPGTCTSRPTWSCGPTSTRSTSLSSSREVARQADAGPAIISIANTSQTRPGGVLAGEVSWQLASAPERGAVRIVWRTDARIRDTHVIESIDLVALPRSRAPVGGDGDGPYRGVSLVATSAGPLEARDTRRFQFRLPDGPLSFVGTLVSLSWAIELDLEPHAATGSDDGPGGHGLLTRRTFVLAPGGTPIQLPFDAADRDGRSARPPTRRSAPARG